MVLDQMEWLSDQIEGTNEMVWETINQWVSEWVSEWVSKASSKDASASKKHYQSWYEMKKEFLGAVVALHFTPVGESVSRSVSTNFELA